MHDLGSIATVLIPVCIVTVLLRQLPFSFIKVLKGSDFMTLLGLTMPVGVMVVLVIYTVKDTFSYATLLGIAITLGIHVVFKRPAVSIIGGTLAYMALVNLF